jgi:hypothetical protein
MPLLITDPVDVFTDPVTRDFPPPGQDIGVTTGIGAVIQGARIRLLLTAGEWFLNLDLGVARFARPGVDQTRVLLGQKFDRVRAIREYRNALLGTQSSPGVPGIVELLQLDVTFDNHTRVQTVIWQARTEFGDTPVDTLLAGGS